MEEKLMKRCEEAKEVWRWIDTNLSGDSLSKAIVTKIILDNYHADYHK